MKVQRIKHPDGEIDWIVLGDDYLPIQPIRQFLKYCRNLERSPNTIEAYARHLKLYWEYLTFNNLDWTKIREDKLAEFIPWLRSPNPRVSCLQQQEAIRSESTINIIISAVYSFYQFHIRLGTVKDLELYKTTNGRKPYKNFLHHINKNKPTQVKLIKLKEPQKAVQSFEKEEVKQLISACNNLRDKFLLVLLYESGMRIGQALGLRHEDIKPWDNQVQIVPRNNVNNARAKTFNSYNVDVSEEVMNLYSDYFQYEYPQDLISDYVFVNICGKTRGKPMVYASVSDLFKRLKKKTGIKNAHPHMFRHTHATELIEAGLDSSIVRERLGHANIQTTINTYTHIRKKALKKVYQDYLEQR